MGSNACPTTKVVGKTVVLDIVALNDSLLSEELTPTLYKLRHSHNNSSGSSTSHTCSDGWSSATIVPQFPALTCVAQSTYLTGKPPQQHGTTY